MNRNKQPQAPQPPNKGSKKAGGFFGDDDDTEASMYFNNSMFRPDKEMMSSGSPSQLTSAFASNLYSQPPVSSMANLRSMNSGPFPRGGSSSGGGHITPTSMGGAGGFPGLPQQQSSPNSSLFPMGQRGILNQMQANQQALLSSQMKRSLPSSLMSSHSSTSSTISTPSVARYGNAPGLWSSKYESQPNFDLSDFPTLGNRSAPVNPLPSAPRNYVGMVSKPAQEPAPEFQIQQEDFPALPGAQNPPATTSTDNSQKTPTTSPGLPSYEAALSKDGGKSGTDKSNQQRRGGIQILPDGTVTNVPPGMVQDQFGMMGLRSLGNRVK